MRKLPRDPADEEENSEVNPRQVPIRLGVAEYEGH
jgi:hypothetical protein